MHPDLRWIRRLTLLVDDGERVLAFEMDERDTRIKVEKTGLFGLDDEIRGWSESPYRVCRTQPSGVRFTVEGISRGTGDPYLLMRSLPTWPELG